MEQDFVAVAYNAGGRVAAFTIGTLSGCKSATKTYRRTKNGLRVYPVVKVMTAEKWDEISKNGCSEPCTI